MQDKLSAEEQHRRQVIGARRRNNIFGENSDYIMMGFLSRGGDGGIYNPNESENNPITIYGRSDSTLYAIKILHDGNTLTPLQTEKIISISAAISAKPILGKANSSSRRVKFLNLDGTKIHSL